MLYVREFEIFQGEKQLVVLPCDMKGATQGVDMQDAIESAADWLFYTVVDALIAGEEAEGGKLGHKPEHDGQIVVVAVDCDLSRVPAYTAAEAARVLGVSPARVAQMVESNQLPSWKEGTRRMVLKDSVDSRLIDRPKPGRPKKNPAGVGVSETGFRLGKSVPNCPKMDKIDSVPKCPLSELVHGK